MTRSPIQMLPQQNIITELCNIIGKKEKWRFQSRFTHDEGISKIIFTKKINRFQIHVKQSFNDDSYFLLIEICNNNDEVIQSNYTAFHFDYSFYKYFEKHIMPIDLFLNEIIYELL